jgi:hypothetical protein
METSSLKKNRPHLESVLGPLSPENDSEIRSILGEIDEILLEIAHRFGRDNAGWDDTGLELTWTASGQTSINSYVSACSQQGAFVDFCVELRPSWFLGERSSELTWQVEFSVSADCGHTVDHSHMHTVQEVTVSAESAVDAAIKLKTAAFELKEYAIGFPLEHWLKLASDPDAEAAENNTRTTSDI